jgi:hypothetical protein
VASILTLDLIKKAMRHIGVIATGETPTADEATDGLAALNDVIETWNLEGLAIFNTGTVTFPTVAGQSSYTIGVGGNWNTTRPVGMDFAYCTVQGVDFPLGMWSLEQYAGVPIKTQQQSIPERYVFINEYPLAKIIIYPTPFAVIPVYLGLTSALSAVASVSTTLDLAPGYSRALAYAVGVELSAQYGAPIDVSAQARATKAYIKRANRKPVISAFDSTLLGPGYAIPARGY